MPRKTKDLTENVENEVIKKSTTKKSSSPKTTNTTKKASSSSKKTSSKKADTIKASSKSTTKKISEKTMQKEAKVKTSTKKASAKVTNKTNKSKKVEILEYYDLPYRYNETIVKILAQTPNTLFVYWDISDEDKSNYIKQYGEYFFNNTKPVLIVHNITKNYNFEVDINDFANSWYLQVNDSNCEYKIELGRKPINNYVAIENNYLHISSSNDIKSPNDHILFESLPTNIVFKNVKTHQIFEKAIIHYLEQVKNTYSIKNFYREMYKDENIDFNKLSINSQTSSSTFK